MGSSVATLVSVGLTSEFGSRLLAGSEKKTLSSTDSVQDAAHRAAFIEGRAFQFNFGSHCSVQRAVNESRWEKLPAALIADMPVDDLYPITPPDFVRRLGLDGEWLSHDHHGRLRNLLNTRIAFQAQLESGLNSRICRTLELTAAMAIDIDVDLPAIAEQAREAHQICRN